MSSLPARTVWPFARDEGNRSAAARDARNAGRLLGVAYGAGAASVLLGFVVLIGWAWEVEPLKAIFTQAAAMKVNAALCFLLAGGALLLLANPEFNAKRAAVAIASLVTGIALATLLEHGSGLNFGIDEWLVRAPSAPAGVNPGRMAPLSAWGFLMAGLTLMLEATAVRLRVAASLARALSVGVLVLGGLSLLGYLFGLRFLTATLPFETIALHTAAGFVVLGGGLLAVATPRAAVGEERRISRLAALLLITTTGVAGVVSFAILGRQVQDTLAQGLTFALEANVETITLNVAQRTERAKMIASGPSILKALRRLRVNPDDTGARALVQGEFKSFLAYGFSGLSITLNNGETVARAGNLATPPDLEVPLAGVPDRSLLWRDGVYLRQRLPLMGGGKRVGTMAIEQSLPLLTGALKTHDAPWPSAEFQLCQPLDVIFRCFPTRLTPHVFEQRAAAAGTPRHLVERAHAHGAGFAYSVDYRQMPELGAYDRVGDLGLVAALKVDAAEIYAPTGRRFAFAIGFIIVLTVLGAWLVRLRVRPLATALETRAREHARSEARFRAVAETASDGFISADAAGRIVYLNPAIERIFGHTAAQISQQPLTMLMPARYHEAHQQGLTRAASTGQGKLFGQTVQLTGLHQTGAEFPLELSLATWTLGEERFFTAVVRDITERKHAEERLQTLADELARSNRELEDFARVASHDLQEPLRKVQAFGDLLAAKCGESLEEQGRDYLTRMQSAAKRMSTLITDLLTFSRVGTRGQPFVTVNLARVAEEVVSDLETRINESGGRVELGDLPTIDADRLQMRQLLQNLLSNALKYRRAEVAPAVRVHGETLEGGDEVRIHVTDNGIGFDMKYLDRIFLVFQRLHGRLEYEGTGIGLAICKKIAERHGGHITADSVLGTGTTFIVTLPIHHNGAQRA